MSKKLSKVLVVAVVLVLSMSLFALVACGGPEPLSGDTAIADLQANFNAAPAKTVKETVTLGGLDVTVAIINLKVKNVTAELTRTYKADGSMTLNAKISNVQVEVSPFDSIATFLPAELGLDSTVISNIKNLVLEAEVVLKNPKNVDPEDVSTYDKYLSLTKFELTGTENVLNKDKQPWPLIQDLDLSSVLTNAENVNPRLVGEDGKPIGIFASMDEYSKDKSAGTLLENFIKDNYQMISAYKFGAVTVDKDGNFSSTAKADLSTVTDLGQKILDQYKDNMIYGESGPTISNLIKTLFGKNMKVSDILNKLTDLNKDASAVTMTGKMAAADDKWMISELHTAQKITVTIDSTLLNNVLTMIGDLAPDAKGTLDTIKGILGESIPTITGSIDAKVDANFTY